MSDINKEKNPEIKGKGNKDFKGGRRKGGKGKKFPKDEPEPCVHMQDVSWYTKYPSLVKGVTNIPWNYVAGTYFKTADGKLRLPNVMRIPFIPAMGLAGDSTDGVNTLARSGYNAMHAVFRGIGSYEQSDFMIWSFAFINLYALITRAERAYGLINRYNVLNRNVPRSLLEAMGLPGNAVFSGDEIADFRANLNFLNIQCRTFLLPKGFTVLARYQEMLSNVFKDSESNRASLYLFDLAGYWEYAENEINTGSALRLVELNTGVTTLDNLFLAPIRSAYAALSASSDVTKFSSDLLAASSARAKDGSFDIQFEEILDIPDGYYVDPIYRFDWLKQIHNIKFVDVAEFHSLFNPDLTLAEVPGYKESFNVDKSTDLDAYDVYIFQRSNVIHSKLAAVPYAVSKDMSGPATSRIYIAVDTQDHLYKVLANGTNDAPNEVVVAQQNDWITIDTDQEFPGSDEVMEITRGTIAYNVSGHTGFDPNEDEVTGAYIEITALGTELFLYPTLVGVVEGTIFKQDIHYPVPVDGTDYNAALVYISAVTKYFDWCFEIGITSINQLTDTIMTATHDTKQDLEIIYYTTLNGKNMELDNPNAISAESLRRIHDVAVMSEFTLDSIMSKTFGVK